MFIRLAVEDIPGILTQVTSYLAFNGIKVKSLNVKKDMIKNQINLELYIKVSKELDTMALVNGVQQIEGVVSIENVT